MNGRILVFETLATNRIILKVRLGSVGYVVDIARSADEVLQSLSDEMPDALILGHGMPGTSLTELLPLLRAQSGCEALPIMVLGPSIAPDKVAAILRAGADCVLARPIADQDLHARLRRLIGAEDALRRLAPAPNRLQALGLAEKRAVFQTPGRIALVTEKLQSALAMRHQLAGLSRHQFLPLLPEEALAGRGDNVDVFVIDERLGNAGNGLRMMAELSSRSGSERARFAIRRVGDDGAPDYGFFDGGADEVLNPNRTAPEIAALLDRLVARKAHFDHLHNLLRDSLRLAIVDPLTGLDNRRSGLAQMAEILKRARLADPPAAQDSIAVIVIDIDRFKSVNDRFGHPVGDRVLIEVARRLRVALRPEDVLCRYGGEEFLAVLVGVTENEARQIAQRLCDQVERHAVAVPEQRAIRVTISAGMAIGYGGSAMTETTESLICDADRALLHSKSAGRNQLTVACHAA